MSYDLSIWQKFRFSKSPESQFAILISCIYLFVASFGIFNHEFWRDELQAWMIAKTALNLNELFVNLQFEGHPGLWHLILFFISRLFDNPESMKIVHIFIATSSVYILNRYAPFSKLYKVFITFGYYLLFEYAMISRSYSLCVLFLFLFCAIYNSKNNYSFLWISILLFLMPNTSFFGLIMASMLVVFIFSEYLISFYKREKKSHLSLRNLVEVSLFFGFGAFLAFLQINTALSLHSKYLLTEDSAQIEKIFCSITFFFKSEFPIPEFWKIDFRDTWFFSIENFTITFAVISLIFLIITVINFRNKLTVIIFFVIGVITYCVFSQLSKKVFLNHTGNMGAIPNCGNYATLL